MKENEKHGIVGCYIYLFVSNEIYPQTDVIIYVIKYYNISENICLLFTEVLKRP